MFMKGPEATWKFLVDRKMISEFPLFGATYTLNGYDIAVCQMTGLPKLLSRWNIIHLIA